MLTVIQLLKKFSAIGRTRSVTTVFIIARHGYLNFYRRLKWFSVFARSVLKHSPIFFLAFLVHVLLSVDNIKVAWEPFLMASPADVSANSSSFHVFVCVSSFLISLLLFLSRLHIIELTNSMELSPS
jgi:hypothetical protein